MMMQFKVISHFVYVKNTFIIFIRLLFLFFGPTNSYFIKYYEMTNTLIHSK